MKSYYGNYLGMVINNNDPEFRGRIQVFVPHIMPTLYEGWNQDGEDITINCVGDNMPQGLTSPIINKLKQILPWADAASPIVGQGISGQVSESVAVDSATGSAEPALILNQTPTATASGTSSSSSTECSLPTESGVNTKQMKPGFIQRLNDFYQEAATLGYKITCSSGYRSPEKQNALYQADLAKNGGKPSGAVARPGSSSHEIGIAVDLKVTGNGVSITQISVAAERNGTNKDTPEFRALLAKHGLHQPLHPKNVPTPSAPESWHIEPIETPKAKQGDRITVNRQVAEKLSDVSTKIGETTSSSQFPPLPNPIEQSSPSNTDNTEAVDSKTGKVPVLAPSSAASTANVASATVTSGPNSGTTEEGGNQLAKDRTAYFRGELNDPELLNRIEFVTKKEGGSSGRLILETACNRAFFSNRSLKEVLFERAYFKDKDKDPNANKTVPHTQFTLNMIQSVIYNGANETDLATDQAYNDKNLFAKKFIDAGAVGSWFDLRTGKKITDPGRITELSTKPGSGMEEFIYQKSGHGDASSKPGQRAKAYGIKYGIKPTSTFTNDTPLPKNLEDARKSSLTGEPLGTNKPPVTVNNTDKHGPTIVKNTNDSAKGLFAFPGVGAMVWVFFREGNPLFPVYFAASYSSNEWKSAYNATGLNPEGTNQGSIGTQAANSMKLNPNAGGGLEFTHIKDTSDPSGAGDKTVAMMYGDDGSNIVFAKGYHQIYSRHDRRDQIDGHSYSIVHGAEERWVEEDSSVNIRGNVFIKIGKVDNEAMEAMKELSDFSKHLNDTLMTNSSK